MMRSMTRTDEPIGRRDVVVAAVFSLLGVLLMATNATDPELGGSWLALPVFLAATLPVLWRRAAPLEATAATLLALLVHIALFGIMTRCGVVFPLVWVLGFAAGARLQRGPALAALALGLASITAMTLFDQQIGPSDLLVFAPVTAIVWGVGRLARSRGRMAAQLQSHTEALRIARDERARLEVAADRVRLSGELDELLQRRLGELATMADAGAADTQQASATATLVDIETESRRTLEQMRAIVGLLREGDGDAPVAPQPTLIHLEALVVRAKGADARLTVAGSPRVLPAGVELSAYRVVEHLLQALDDAPGVDVGVRFSDDALELTVSGPARRRSDGSSAIERARERVALHRGTLEAHFERGRARAVAQLPVHAGA